MRTYRAAWTFGLTLLFVVSACSLAVDTSELDAGCGATMKLCSGQCVEISDPAYGCDPVNCAPCHAEHYAPKCEGEKCAIDYCLWPWGCDDCSANLLTSEIHCGQCFRDCPSGQTCSNGECVVTELPAPTDASP